MIEFLIQVLDPAREVYEEKTSVADNVYRRMNMKFKTIAVYTLQIFLIFLYLLFIMHPPLELFEICRARTEHDLHTSNLDHLCRLNSDSKIMATPSWFSLFIFFAFVYFGVGLMLDLCLRLNQDLEALLNQRILSLIKRKKWKRMLTNKDKID